MAESHEPIPISSVLDGVVASLRGPDRKSVGGLFAHWDEAVGEQIAAHVRPIKLDQQVLIVEVDEPAWATQVKFVTPTIIDRLKSIGGVDVDRLEVRVERRSARGAKF